MTSGQVPGSSLVSNDSMSVLKQVGRMQGKGGGSSFFCACMTDGPVSPPLAVRCRVSLYLLKPGSLISAYLSVPVGFRVESTERVIVARQFGVFYLTL